MHHSYQAQCAALDIKIKQRHPSEFHRKTKVRSIADIDDSRRYWATGISVTRIENNGIDRDNLFLYEPNQLQNSMRIKSRIGIVAFTGVFLSTVFVASGGHAQDSDTKLEIMT